MNAQADLHHAKHGTDSATPREPLTRFGTPAFYCVSAVTFFSAALLTAWLNYGMSMSMPMPGGWNMGMMWMELASGSLRAVLVFVAMWVSMMVAMMLPSTLPMLLLYRRVAVFRADASVGFRTWLVASGYFGVWAAFGVLVCFLGAMVSRLAMSNQYVSLTIPIFGGLALMIAGAYQLTPWKGACLRHCQNPFSLLSHHLDSRLHSALILGLHHGAYCTGCCWGLMLIQLALGVMNVYVMVAIALIIALEKLLPIGPRLAKWTGVLAIIFGATVIAASFHQH